MLTETGPTFGVRDHLDVLYRYKRRILLVLITVIVITGPGSFTLSEVYQAKSRILIQQNREPIKIGAALTQSQASTIDSSQDAIKTQIEVFKSPLLIERLVNRLGADTIQQSMRWRWDWLSSLPAQASDWVRNLFVTKKPAPHDWYAAQKIVKHIEIKPVIKTDVFEVYFYAPNPQFAAKVLNLLVELYLDHQAALFHGKGAKDFFNQEVKNAVAEVKQAQQKLLDFKKQHGIVQISAQQQILLQKINDAKSKYSHAQLKMLAARKRIAAIRQQLAGKSQFTMEQTQYQRLQSALSLEQRNLEALSASNKYKQEVGNYQLLLNNLNEKEGEYNNLLRQVKLKEEALSLYQKKQEETRINIKLDSQKISNITPIEMASVPINPVLPQKKRNIVIGLIVGTLAGIMLAYLSNFFRRTLLNPDEIEKAFKLPVFATLPKQDQCYETETDTKLEIQSFRERIFRIQRESKIKSLLITSTMAGEGKLTVSQLLSSSLATSGSKVLLVQNKPCLEYAATKKTTEKTYEIMSASQENLYFLVSNNNLFEDDSNLKNILKTLENDFDFIIVSGTSVNSESNILSIAAAMDGLFIVVEADLVSRYAVSKTIKLLESAGASVMGFVLNKRKRYIPNWVYRRVLGVS